MEKHRGTQQQTNRGFTLIELLIVVGLVAVLTAMAVGFSVKYSQQKSVDNVVYRVSSALKTARLQALKNGMEYTTQLAVNTSPPPKLTVKTKRGSTEVSRTVITLPLNYDIVDQSNAAITSHDVNFKTNGTVPTASLITINIKPNNARITKCGQIGVSRLGRVKKGIGNMNGTNCSFIKK